MMDKRKNGGWRFYRGKHGWRWRCIDPDRGILIRRSARTFRAWDECLDDAILHGYMMQRPSERRAEQRVDVDLSGTLSFGEASSVCSVRNMCSKGFLIVAKTEGLPRGQAVQLAVHLYPDRLVSCTGQIKHVDAQRLGAMVLDMAEGDQAACRRFISEQRQSRSR